MFCTKCGSELDQNARFCANCGNEAISAESNDVDSGHTNYSKLTETHESINRETQEEGRAMDSSSFVESEDDLVKQFVGKKSDYYLRKWNSSKDPARGIGWNWAAFIFSVFWMAYRKMYMYTAMYILIWLGFGIILELLHNDRLANNLSIFLAISAGMSGNVMYYKFTKKNIEKYKTKQLEQPLEKKGRTSWGGAFAAIVSMLVGAAILQVLADL